MMRSGSATGMRAALFVTICAIGAIAIQSLVVPIDADVSWLITVSERVLAGDRLHVDVFEVNPPASVWIYIPQVALAKTLGLRPEAVVVALTTLLASASALAFARIASRDLMVYRATLAAVAGIILLVLPGGLFAQREHYALILALPIAAIMALLAKRERVEFGALIAAGVAAGLVVVIKPHFLLAMLLPALYAGWASKGWRPILIAGAMSSIVIAVYGAAIVALTPQYFALLPMLAEVYGPMRARPFDLLVGVAVAIPLALAGLVWLLRPGRLDRLPIILVAMLGGFTLAVLIQGKGYWNHALPGIGLGLTAIACVTLAPSQSRSARLTGGGAMLLISSFLLGTTLMIQPPQGLVGALKEVAPPHPTVISLGTELSDGHPAVRLVDGRWVGSRASLFTAAGVRFRTHNWTTAGSPSLRRWYDEDIAIFAREVDRHRPDVIIAENESMPWLHREPSVRAALVGYRPAKRVGGLTLWLRARTPCAPSTAIAEHCR